MQKKKNIHHRVKGKLKDILAEESIDNDLLLSLTHELVSSDEKNVRFSIDAGVIDRLGQELVARQETAVSELVKNAYDADAKTVLLTFEDSEQVGGTLVVQDDGDGMSRDDIINCFMRISSTEKIHYPISKRYKRKRAGQKGIGRFAVQRLARKLTIITRPLNSPTSWKLVINWDDYVNDSNLLTITNTLEPVDNLFENGTRLILDKLRDKWTATAIKRVYRYVSNIIQPFPLSKDESLLEDAITSDPGFKVEFHRKKNGVLTTIADENVMIHNHAIAEIEGYIDDTGQGIYTIESSRLKIDEIGEIGNDPDDPSVPFTELKDVRFRAYYFIYDSDLIPKMHSTGIRKLASKEGGIRLYRNGFRVLPYAETGDDWLDFDKSSRRRTILFPHSNSNFFGFVELKDENNIFNETSSREGIINNEAFRQLKNFVHRAIITGVVKVANVRGTKITPSQKKDDEGNWEEIEIRIKNIAHSLETLDKELEDNNLGIETKKKRKKSISKIKKDINDLKNLHKAELKKSLKERSMLRVLSSVGLTVSQFIHEIKYYTDNLQSDVRFLLNELEGQHKAMSRIKILDKNFRSFHTYTSYFNSVVSQNLVRELIPINMKAIVTEFLTSMKSDADNSGITFQEPKFNQLWLYTKPMHPSEWSSILFNFYTNSKKAIKRSKAAGMIFIEAGAEDGSLYLEFSDNGDGISKDIEGKVFDEFFTTTSPQHLDNLDMNTEVLGTGLGLKIVKDIVRSYRGNVYVTSPKGSYSTCIRIEISKASEKDEIAYGL